MTGGAGGRAGADVVIVAEQLRRRVPGGIGTYVSGLLGGLNAQATSNRLDVSLVASRTHPPDPLQRFGFPIRALRIPPRLIAKAWDLGLSRVDSNGLVHATSFAMPPTPAKLVVTVHDLAFLDHPDAYPARGLRWHRDALHRSIERASAFVVPAEPVAAQLILAGAEPSIVRVIEEGADHLPEPDEAAARRLLGERGLEGEFLLAVGTLEPRKNLRRLVSGYAIARPNLPAPYPLAIAGPSGWGEAFGPPPEGVVLLGSVPAATLAALYRLARVVCYVPIEEGFGLPVVEAMREGTPVVSSDVPSAKGASIMVDPLDPASIAEGLITASTDEVARAVAIEAGYRRTADLTWSRCAALHLDLWGFVLGRPSA
jgi:glycosyltransferase involved in cell wall biosynthesis